jgi:hypothetical protein
MLFDDSPSTAPHTEPTRSIAVRGARSSQSSLSAALTLVLVVIVGGLVLLQQGGDPLVAASAVPCLEPSPSPELASASPELASASADLPSSPAASSTAEPCPEPSPSPPPPSSAEPSLEPSSTPEATSTATAPPPSQDQLWQRIPFDAMDRWDSTRGMWLLGERFVMLNRQGYKSQHPEWYVLSSSDGLTWERTRFPFEVREYDDIGASTSEGGRISLFARVVRGSESSWELLSTADGREWTSSGTVDLPMNGRQFTADLVRTSGGWITSRNQSWLEETLWESEDGRHWTMAAEQLPHRDLDWLFVRRFGSATLAFGVTSVPDAGPLITAIVRRDGETSWTTAEFTLPQFTSIERIECRSDGCVAVGMIFDQAAAWYSGDGLAWSAVDLENPLGSDYLRAGPLVVSDAGYLILTASTGHAWFSTNGRDWRTIRTQSWDFDDPSVFPDYMGRAVASGDLVLALGAKEDGPESGEPVLWLGRFSAILE